MVANRQQLQQEAEHLRRQIDELARKVERLCAAVGLSETGGVELGGLYEEQVRRRLIEDDPDLATD